MKRIIAILAIGVGWSSLYAATITLDPSALPIGTDVTNHYSGIKLTEISGPSASGEIGDPVITGFVGDPFSQFTYRAITTDGWSLGADASTLQVEFFGSYADSVTFDYTWFNGTTAIASARLDTYSTDGTYFGQVRVERNDPTEIGFTAPNNDQIRIARLFFNSGVGLVGPVQADISPVPIPAAAWLFGSALGLLGWMRRGKR